VALTRLCTLYKTAAISAVQKAPFARFGRARSSPPSSFRHHRRVITTPAYTYNNTTAVLIIFRGRTAPLPTSGLAHFSALPSPHPVVWSAASRAPYTADTQRVHTRRRALSHTCAAGTRAFFRTAAAAATGTHTHTHTPHRIGRPRTPALEEKLPQTESISQRVRRRGATLVIILRRAADVVRPSPNNIVSAVVIPTTCRGARRHSHTRRRRYRHNINNALPAISVDTCTISYCRIILLGGTPICDLFLL